MTRKPNGSGETTITVPTRIAPMVRVYVLQLMQAQADPVETPEGSPHNWTSAELQSFAEAVDYDVLQRFIDVLAYDPGKDFGIFEVASELHTEPAVIRLQMSAFARGFQKAHHKAHPPYVRTRSRGAVVYSMDSDVAAIWFAVRARRR